ncbi:MAG TPA: hypothetical protein VLA45_07070 [Paracoccaceae bacterium]|nr:hypothetical protein [Paracoccaceae bacterium]
MALLLKSAQPAPGEHFWLVLGGILFVFAVSFAAMLPWWRTMDDMQKHGHMISWYWGGLGGGVAMFAWLVAGAGAQSDAVKGAVALMIGQVVGFFAFWAVWMVRQRGAKE